MSHTITARECRFVTHIPSPHPSIPDLHVVKEQRHCSDGVIRPAINIVENFKRPFYVTKTQYQNHEQKKEWESAEKLNIYSCTESELRDQVARALGKPWSKERLARLAKSPYLYGTDISAGALIGAQYKKQFPDVQTPYTFATFDVETNVLEHPEERRIIMATVSFGNQVFTAVQKSFLNGINDPIRLIDRAMNKYLGEYVQKLNLQCTTVLCEREIDIVIEVFRKLHEWKPDFLTIWNMDFDIQRVMDACGRAGIDPKDIFSDPVIPKDRRFFTYKQGKKKRVTASGREIPINPAAQWHTVYAPSSFYVIDAMCVYRLLRLSNQEQPSYRLDHILSVTIGARKLKFEEANKYKGLPWHQFMQQNFKIEYIIYNRFDSISMVEQENKIKDVSFTLPSQAGFSSFDRFNSQTKKISDAMYFFCLEENLVFASYAPPDKKEERPDVEEGEFSIEDEDEIADVLSCSGWVVTLAAHKTTDSGMRCLAECPDTRTNVRAFVEDIDAVSSYPSDVLACNVSKETTKREIVSIGDIDEFVFRMQNINALSGPINAIEYCTTMFNFPRPEELLAAYTNQI